MAGNFACDPQEAELVARELTRMGSDMRLSLSRPLEGATGVVGSEAVGAALREFVQAATVTRAELVAAVGSAAGLFAGLAEGTLDLDKAFADRATET
ncbi:hypothetical protein B7755_012925 [Streptomyces sp. NBS 14/10]|uniref:hypothetical protein n=1 Tax=Streptomyces sp. NBS 14/10 TaxID=1945643 RepID=UPI000B7CDAE4|nr:hypothetical protein [Streptomyces sp. NBS 14/10]KAK1178970.1 hypothetical protein B7755_012925 [Streptomyces sp. NBS 14/10]